MNNLYNYFEKVFNENKLVQSYLIGNTKYDLIKEDLIKIINNFFFKNNINVEDNPDLYILKNDENNISKDDIKDLIKNVNTTSQFNNIKVYIIDECEILNDYITNALLKTLEEPSPNVYAFLITKNINSVKSTISSRCQKLFISSEVLKEELDDEIIKLAEEFINIIENEELKTIGRHPEIYSKISDKEIFKKILIYIQNKYVDNLNSIVNNKLSIDDEIEKISKRILIINNNINLLNNNLNKNLSIDRFIIEIWRCSNENS